MNKRTLHHYARRLDRLKPWYFFALALVSGVICIFALRANNQHMVVLREAVYKADRENGDVQGALQDLQAYVTRHMNTNLDAGPNAVYPPIQLQYTYQRLVEAQGAGRAKANQDLYTEAQKYCESQNSQDFSGRNRVPCIQQYVQARTTPATAPIPDALYKFSFVTPKWSPDLAGWSMVVAILSAVAGVILFIVRSVMNRMLRS
jgi:hypothetical protein